VDVQLAMSITQKSPLLSPSRRPARGARAPEERPTLFPRRCRYGPVKRAFDVVFALVFLAATGPLILLLAALVKLTSRGPAFYTQIRLGLGGRPFTVHKLRTMYDQCECFSGPQWATPGDPRITKLGRVLRKTHLDELPQLWDIFFGKMSLVGPRPERAEFVPQLERAIPFYRARLSIRPGLTGFAQVQLPPDSDLASVGRKLSYDLYYVQHFSLWLDILIVLSTVFHVVGLPGRLSQDFFDLPSWETVERKYQELIVQKQRSA
jgi:lipopolysaccharide/colanic/teichoic acid biosynthesis glycosyltransferase